MTTAIIGVGQIGGGLARDLVGGGERVVLAARDQSHRMSPQAPHLLEGKVVVDPSNPVGYDDKGEAHRTLPEGTSAGSVVAGLLPAGTHYVKAFGSLGAPSLASDANRSPHRAALFYATDDDRAAAVIERLITAAGFDPVKA